MRTVLMMIAGAAVTAATSLAHATEIYATNHLGTHPNSGPDTLVRFNAENPADFVTIGSLGVDNIGFGGLEFDADGNLWAYATFNQFGGAASGLYSINTKTGAATVQGSISSQTLNDLAFNPVNNTMYGVFSQAFANGRLYSVNLTSGAVTMVGQFTGLDSSNNLVGLAIDSSGTFYVFDNMNNKLYRSDDELNLTLLYSADALQCEGCASAVGSQGIAIDWSRNDVGYHGAIGQGVFPNYYNNLNSFALDGSAYTWGPSFGPNHADGLPQVQPGDLAIVPTDAKPTDPADLNNDGVVDVSDLLILLSHWGQCPDGAGCAGDLNSDGTVDVSDLLILLAAWG